ncbi:hypothetical protein LCGC14_2591680, partial [marine sediment metagenome]
MMHVHQQGETGIHAVNDILLHPGLGREWRCGKRQRYAQAKRARSWFKGEMVRVFHGLLLFFVACQERNH